jgi:hypothetical protein
VINIKHKIEKEKKKKRGEMLLAEWEKNPSFSTSKKCNRMVPKSPSLLKVPPTSEN